MNNNKCATKLERLPFDVHSSAYKCIFLMFCHYTKTDNLGQSECWLLVLKSLFLRRHGCLECVMCDLGILNH